MSSYFLSDELLSTLEERGLATRTFRRLDPPRREAVIQAIFEVGAESGAEATGMREVALKAGVSVGSLYQYFKSRERMIDFACTWVAESIVASFAPYQAEAGGAPLEETLSALLDFGISWGEENPAFLRFFAASAYAMEPGAATVREKLVVPVVRATRALLDAAIDGAAERGEFEPGIDADHAKRIASLLLFASGDSFLLPSLDAYWGFAAGTDRKALIASVVAFVSRALRGRP